MERQSIPAITPELRQAVARLRAAQAHTDAIRPVVEKYKRELMIACGLTYSADFGERAGQPITDLRDSWKADSESHARWCAALDEAHKAHGFEVAEPGQCPLLVAEHEEIKAGKAVCAAAAYISGVGAEHATASLRFREYVEKAARFVEAVQP